MNPNPPSNPAQFGAPPPPPSAAEKKPAGMAWTAFILSLFGCMCLPAIPAFILGLIVLIKDKGGKGLAIASLVLSGLAPVIAFFIFGVGSAIAIPNFVKFQARAKQAECKSNLKALYTAEKSFFQETERYSEDLQEIGFNPESPRRYSYFVSQANAPLAADLNPVTSLDELPGLGDMTIGIVGECPACEFTAVCAGNIDADSTFDIWGISTTNRMEGDTAAPAGQPYQLANDVDN